MAISHNLTHRQVQAELEDNGYKRVWFTELQLAFIEKHFPEQIINHTSSEAELRQYMGQRQVIQFIRKNVQT